MYRNFSYKIYIKILLSIPDIDNIYIPQIDKIIFVHISYGNLSINDAEKYHSVQSIHTIHR